MASTRELLIHILRDRMNASVDETTGDFSLGPDGLDLESLSITELVMHCEDALSVRIPESEYQQVPRLTIQGLADYLDLRVHEKA